MKTALHLPGPEPPGRAKLRDLLKKVVVDIEEERELRREAVHVEPRLERRLHVCQTIVERKGQLLYGGRTGLADVIAADTDGVPFGDMLRAITERVHNEPQVRLRREQPLLLRDVFLQNIVLECPAELVERDSPPFRHRQVHR